MEMALFVTVSYTRWDDDIYNIDSDGLICKSELYNKVGLYWDKEVFT